MWLKFAFPGTTQKSKEEKKITYVHPIGKPPKTILPSEVAVSGSKNILSQGVWGDSKYQKSKESLKQLRSLPNLDLCHIWAMN